MGKANSLRARVRNYFNKSLRLGQKTSVLVSKIQSVDHIVVSSEIEALLLEANLIKKYSPVFNVRWTDGKAYPFIKITIKDRYPAVLQSRHIDDLKALYFGPYPNIGDVRRIFKSVRKIFPYVSVRNHPKKLCLYYHLGLCPCPNVFDLPKTRRSYLRNIRLLIRFLEGKKKSVVLSLKKLMIEAAKKEDFETAAAIKRQLDTINLITSPVRTPLEYIVNPNLLSDEAKLDLESLKTVLSHISPSLSRFSRSRIECYDVSNIQGRQATGSMVVATNGLIDKSQYRRFKIRLGEDGPDDVAMMKEMLTRRLKHTEWQKPDLIVVDGGIGQVNMAVNVLKDFHDQYRGLPVIGLAKRLEEIVIPALHLKGAKLNSRIITLPRDHRALKLLKRLRDESHRFALSYHRNLRLKTLLS